MIARTALSGVALLALASCTPFHKNKDDYNTAGNPYGVPGYDTSGTEAGTYTPENSTAANPTYAPAAYEENTAATGKATPPASKPSAAAPAASASHAAGAKVHTVVKGDTLWGLAKKYGVTADAIKAANHMTKDTVVLGSKLNIPAP